MDPQLTSSPSAARWAHTRLLCLLVGILAASVCLFGAAVAWGLPAGKDTFAFMAAEVMLYCDNRFLILFKNIYTLICLRNKQTSAPCLSLITMFVQCSNNVLEKRSLLSAIK